MKRHLVAVLAVLAPMLASVPAQACFSACNWSTWGERIDVCASPSEGLAEDAVACWCDGPCSDVCAGMCDGFSACAASGDPDCYMYSGATDACVQCAEGHAPYFGSAGCRRMTLACSYDRTGCVTCSSWLMGGQNCHNLCPGPLGPDAISAEIDLSQCACGGGCPACASACQEPVPGFYYLDVDSASFACAMCLGGPACAPELAACQGS